MLDPLAEILLLLLCATLAGADDDVTEVALWGEENLPPVRPLDADLGVVGDERRSLVHVRHR